MAGYLRVIIMPLAMRKRAAVECRKCIVILSMLLRLCTKSIDRAEAQRRREICLQTRRKLCKFTVELGFVWRVLIDRIFMVFSVANFRCVGNPINCSKSLRVLRVSALGIGSRGGAEARRKFLCELCELCANKNPHAEFAGSAEFLEPRRPSEGWGPSRLSIVNDVSWLRKAR